MQNLNHYKLIADLFRYPDENLINKAIEFVDIVNKKFPGQSQKIAAFVTEIEKRSTKKQQEYFMKTFDVQAVCYLDIGYMMFGEDYKRAQLLVNLQNEHKIASIDCGTELADHLPNVLCLLAKTANEGFATELGYIITMPAVRFMLMKFKNIDNYYAGLFEVLLDMLQLDFPGDGLNEYAFADEAFSGKNEFLIPSPKMTICDSNCKPKKH
jgi:nitrate reductase assembly molybdenum cofactor insertion protein NarJ